MRFLSWCWIAMQGSALYRRMHHRLCKNIGAMSCTMTIGAHLTISSTVKLKVVI
jgi:hypothetical protein